MAAPRAEEPALRLASLRARMDTLDSELLRLLNQRARLSLEFGALKKAASLQVHDPKREEQILQRLAAMNNGPLPQEQLRTVYQAIFQASRLLQA